PSNLMQRAAGTQSFCFSTALFPSELLERSLNRSAPLARSCPILLSFFASSLAAASRRPSAARSPFFDDSRSTVLWVLLHNRTADHGICFDCASRNRSRFPRRWPEQCSGPAEGYLQAVR